MSKITCDITFSYKNKDYNFKYDFGEYSKEGADYMFSEGNYSCDCNRSIFIQEYCDKNFPKMKCGEKIELKSFEIRELNYV